MKRESKSDVALQIVIIAIISILFLLIAYPLYFVIIASVSDPTAVSAGRVVLFPVKLNLDGYLMVLKRLDVMRGFGMSVFYTVMGTAINVIVTIPAAYALSRHDLKGRKHILFFFTFTMFFGGGLIPTFLVVKRLGLLDSVWSLTLPGAMSVYNMMVAMSFFRSSIPGKLLDAARIDGCNNIRFFVKIVVPLSTAIIAIMILYYGVGHWNSYFSAMIYISDPKKFPLQLVLRGILIQNTAVNAQTTGVKDMQELMRMKKMAEIMKYSLVVISSLPVLLVYPFVEKYFVKGVMIGSLKG